MPLRLLLGPAGARKTGRLLDAHQAAARGGRIAWLVVPSGADLVPVRRELLGLDAPGGARRTATPYAEMFGAPELERRLLQQVGGPPVLSQDGRRLIAQAVVRTAQREEQLDALLPGARRGWLADELVALSEELTITGDLGAGAEEALEAWGGGAGGKRGRELAALLRDDARRRTAIARGGHGPVDRATAALRVVAAIERGAVDLADLHLTFAGFDDLDPVQRRLLLALARSSATVLLSLPYASGREALAAAGPLVRALQDAGADTETVAFDPALVDVDPALATLGARLFEVIPEGATPVPSAEAPAPATIVELRGAGPDEELALVGELVAEELAAGTPADRLAVLAASPSLHAPAIVAALGRRGIAAHVGGRPPAASTSIVRGTMALLRAAGDGPGEAADLVAWLALVDRDRAEQLDAAARRRDARTVRDALGIWSWLGGPRVEELDRLRDAARGRGPEGESRLPGVLERTVAAILDERAIAWITGDGGRPDPGTERAVRAAREAARAIDARAGLIERAWKLSPPVPLAADLTDLARTLEELRLEAEPEPEGSVPVVGPLAVRTRTLDVLVVARAQRGVFPAPESARRALAPADRGVLSADHGWPTPIEPQHAAAERLLAYEIATTPTRRLALAWHAGDGDGGAAEPSPLLAEVRRVAGEAVELRTLNAGAAAVHGLSPERRVALEQAAAGPRHREVQHERSEAIAAEHRDHHGVGALQTASRCTAQWFVEQHLKPKALDPDAAPLTAGRLRHDLLAELLRGALERGAVLAPETLPLLEAGLATAARRLAEEGKGKETLAERLMRERVVAEVEATLPTLVGTRELQHQPSEIELSFGTSPRGDGDDAEAIRPPVTIRRGEHELAVSGRIDRLDVSKTGDEVVVVDYKGASVENYRGRGWIERRELQAGLYALVAEELTGATPVGSLYQAVPGPPELPPRGATVERLDERGQRRGSNDVVGADDWAELLDELVALAAQAADAIDDGRIAPVPARCSEDGCRHPWLCREQRG
ncbi:MAG: PD-(D/E)XK nuclease family protein [Patulibacter minatonensis]